MFVASLYDYIQRVFNTAEMYLIVCTGMTMTSCG